MKLKDYCPNLETAYNALSAFLQEHQGEKGYFRTDDDGYDSIWGFEYNYDVQQGIEKRVLGVRYNENNENEIEVFFAPESLTYFVTYTEDDFKNEDNWESLRFSDVYFRDTLLNILDFIEEYIDEN